jgi:hypothetical protein
MDKGQMTESVIAAAMREALDQADWSPDGDPEAAISALLTLCSTVDSVITDDADPGDLAAAGVVFESEPLAAVYLFTGEVRKRVDQQHPALPPGYAMLPRSEFVEGVIGVLPYFHRRQAEVSDALGEAFGRGDAGPVGRH